MAIAFGSKSSSLYHYRNNIKQKNTSPYSSTSPDPYRSSTTINILAMQSSPSKSNDASSLSSLVETTVATAVPIQVGDVHVGVTVVANKECSGQTSTIWDRFADGYSKSKIVDEESYKKKIEITQSYLTKDMTVLEIGCGTGSISLLHAPYVKNIIATDISEKMIAICKQKLSSDDQCTKVTNVDFQQISIDQMQINDASIDVVLGLSILHLLKNRNDAINKVSTWLKPNGLFISSTICLGDQMNNIGYKILTSLVFPVGNFLGLLPHVSTVTKNQLKEELLSNGFTIEYEWQPNEKAAIFLIARKKNK